jgi:hypothetical protein
VGSQDVFFHCNPLYLVAEGVRRKNVWQARLSALVEIHDPEPRKDSCSCRCSLPVRVRFSVKKSRCRCAEHSWRPLQHGQPVIGGLAAAVEVADRGIAVVVTNALRLARGSVEEWGSLGRLFPACGK